MQLDALTKAGCQTIFSEQISGAAKRRPGLDKAIAVLRRGDVLVVWAIDRIARSLPDLIKRIEAIDQRGAGIRVISQPIDTTGPTGRLILNILGAVADFERSLIQMRTRAGVQRRIAKGLPVGRKRLLSDAQIRAIRSARKSGESVRFLAAEYGVSEATIRAYSVDKER